MSTQDGNDSGENLYELHDVERIFSRGGVEVRAVRGVTFNIRKGEMVSLEGPSGSGKSTLLLLLGALDVPTKGSIVFAGRELGRESDKTLTSIRSEQIGFVFQNFNLIPTLTAAENVEVAMVPSHASRVERKERASVLLNQVGLGHRLDHLPSRLSGGEQQRVSIARALANSPRVIIADEPTGNLDSENAQEVMSLLSGLRQSAGVTIIVATHAEEVARLAERRVRLRDGSVVDGAAA